MCCNVIVPPCDPAADAGFVIVEQTEYPPMSGSNTICVVTVLLETGIVPMAEPVLEAPAGLIRVRAACKGGKVTRVTFRNVPAFAVHLDAMIKVAGYRAAMVRLSEALRAAAVQQLPVVHPDNPDITGPTIAQLTAPPNVAGTHGRGLLEVRQDYVNGGPLGTTFNGRIAKETRVGPYRAIIPELSGQAWIYGTSQWTIDPTDPFPQGYTMGDTRA